MRYLFLVFVIAGWLPAAADPLPPVAAIASAHPIATAAGFEVLEAGGNAFDAAVAVSATLAVVEPYSSGLGGGGFWLLHRAADNSDIMLDGRETAPGKASRNMYLDTRGEVVPGRSVDGPLAAGIPGEPAALVWLAEKYGRLPLKTSLVPAIRAAEQGFAVTAHYRRMAQFRLDALRASPAAAAVFLHKNDVPPLGQLISQPDLALTLERLANQGHQGFYGGKLAQALVQGTDAAGGIWRLEDLRDYRVIERAPIISEYRGYRIVSAAPPSSGGVALVTMLNILQGYPLETLSAQQRKHRVIEAMRRAYRDRAEYLGDPDFVKVPVAELTSPAHAAELRSSIQPDSATPSQALKPVASPAGGFHTTHFSVLDRAGNRVAATLSINYPFGSGFMPPGTGVLLNDEMDDFSAKPGVPNVYGLVGAEANAIAPGKRMLSSMSPTFVEGPDRIAILGTPGGSRIITMVLHGILGVTENKSAQQIVSEPRYHHQYLPDVVQYEAGSLTEKDQDDLQLMGHQLKQLDQPYGNMQAVIWNRKTNTVSAASDPRGEGQARVGP